jgi:hypothetical protein
MSMKPKAAGALQALGLVAYVILIASVMRAIGSAQPEHALGPVLGPALFLLIFSASALICGAITLGYPLILFFREEKKREAFGVVGWTIVWLALFAFLAIFFLLAPGLFS